MNILQKSKDVEEYIIKCRRDLHQYPEVGTYLPNTIKYVKERLDELGVEYDEFKSCSGLTCVIGSKDGKVVGIRADMDGLPMKEDNDVEYKSQNNNMHACGHDTHTAMLLGIAKILKENEEMLKGRVKLIFQPAEELGTGAKLMLDEGALINPKVDVILAQHVANLEGLKSGMVLTKENNIMASADFFKIKVIGRGGHASTPELTVDPIFISTQIINSIYAMLSREICATDSVTISICNIKSEQQDKVAYNIIPNYVEIYGTVRCQNNSHRDFIEKRMRKIIDNTTSQFNASFDFEYIKTFPALINDKNITKLLIDSANKVVGSENVILIDKPVMGSEDVSYFFEEVPGAYFGLITNRENETPHVTHHPKFNVDEKALIKGANVLLQATIDYLNN